MCPYNFNYILILLFSYKDQSKIILIFLPVERALFEIIISEFFRVTKR